MRTPVVCGIIFLILLPAACGTAQRDAATDRPAPNIIYILADDLGYGDLGCYGQQKFTTPHIDRMAREGIRFTRHYSGSTVCAPSRSVLMTGFHTGHTPVRGNREVQPEGQFPLPASSVTVAEMLREKDYVTAAFGKWGLGFPGSEGDPLHQGFDRFFGYNCQRYAHRYYPAYLWDDSRQYVLEGNNWTRTSLYAPDVIQEKTLDFIREHRDHPFFVFVPVILPHAELLVPRDTIFQRYLGDFPEEPYRGGPGAEYGPEMVIGRYCSQEAPRATFAAMVTRPDLYVGEILRTLEELGIAENTLVILTSDNGPHREGGADPEFFGSSGGLRGIKRDLYEGGIRVPMIAWWPGTIAPGRISDHVSAFWDVFPTLAELAGADPGDTDGISFLPELLGNEQAAHPFLYWEFHEQGGKQALLLGDWKAIRLGVGTGDGTTLELYHLKDDPGENRDLAAKYPERAEEMLEIMQGQHQPSGVFRFGREEVPGE